MTGFNFNKWFVGRVLNIITVSAN